MIRTKYRKYQKGKCRSIYNCSLNFGRYAIQSCETGIVRAQTIEATRRVLSRKFRLSGAQIWIKICANVPITRKPTEVRMGKGKGNPAGWVARVSKGQILFEMDGVTLSNAQSAARYASHKLNVATKFVQWK